MQESPLSSPPARVSAAAVGQHIIDAASQPPASPQLADEQMQDQDDDEDEEVDDVSPDSSGADPHYQKEHETPESEAESVEHDLPAQRAPPSSEKRAERRLAPERATGEAQAARALTAHRHNLPRALCVPCAAEGKKVTTPDGIHPASFEWC